MRISNADMSCEKLFVIQHTLIEDMGDVVVYSTTYQCGCSDTHTEVHTYHEGE